MVKIVDCTLRDGGYYNNWEFGIATVKKYLSAMKDSGINIVELGYRSLPSSLYYGPYAYCSEDFLQLLELPDGLEFAVMIDEKVVSHYPDGVRSFFDHFFVNKDISVISIVRVAVHQERVEHAKNICLQLQELGYRVCLNVMQIHSCSSKEIENIATQATSWNCINTLYFADSMGSLNARKIKEIVHSLKSKWKGKIGFHGHNNCNSALDNTMTAHGLGCTWLDATVCGMGRGAGNTPTEMLLIALNGNDSELAHLNSLFEIVLNEFTQLKEKYKWGGNLLYQLSAINNVHPTYVQQMLTDTNHDTSSLIEAVYYLSKNEGHKYSEMKLHEACMGADQVEGKNSLSGYFSGKKLLIIGPGGSVEDHQAMLELIIVKHDLTVLSTSFEPSIDRSLVDYYVSSNFLKNYSKLRNISYNSSKFIVPGSSLSGSMGNTYLLDYELVIEKNVFEISDRFARLPTDKSLLYALSVATISEPDEVFLAGFDGYNYNDTRFKEVSSALALFEKSYGYKNIRSFTNTKYNLPFRSLYEPWI